MLDIKSVNYDRVLRRYDIQMEAKKPRRASCQDGSKGPGT